MILVIFMHSSSCDSTACSEAALISPLTHPETAWLTQASPVLIMISLALLLMVVFHTRLGLLLAELLERYGASWRREPVDSSLLWLAPLITPGQLLGALTVVALLVIGAVSFVAPGFLALLLALPLSAGLGRLLLAGCTGRYIDRLDRALPAAVGRLGAQLRGGNSFQIALQRVLADLPAGALRGEWGFIIERINVPLAASGSLATPAVVVRALAAQTPSARHAAFLGQLEVALQQTQDVQARRVEAAYQALQDSERQRSASVTELAQMRYSGMAVGGAGIFMAIYLALTQWERTVAAYSSLLGLIVGPIVLMSLLLPIVGGFMLARVDDIDY